MADNAVTWLHFSDLHARADKDTYQEKLLAALWDDIKYHLDEGLSPDFLVFSGDVAHSGTPEEYAVAEERFFGPLLDITELPHNRMAVVPGNHDSDWSIAGALDYPDASRFGSAVEGIIVDTEDRSRYLTPLSAYMAFASQFDEIAPSGLVDELGALRRMRIDDKRVAMLCLNSAWLSGPMRGKPSAQDGAPDQGLVAVGERQLTDVMRGLQSEDLVLALVHHPLEFLHESDRSAMGILLVKECQFLLCGHLHDARVRINEPSESELVQVPAGCLYGPGKCPNTYTIATYDFGTDEVKLVLRRYQPEVEEWQRDLASTGDRNNGELSFQANTLRGITRLVEDEELPVREDERTAALAQAVRGPNTRVESYDLDFSDECLRSLARVGLTREGLIDLVQGEFRSHINYFRFDLEHYPLPLRAKFIVYIDKVGNQIRFRDVAPCTADLAMLSAWHDILAVYRGATRLRYRDEPNALVGSPGFLARVMGVHDDLSGRVVKYFDQFLAAKVDPSLIDMYDQLQKAGLKDKDGRLPVSEPTEDERLIGFYLRESKGARADAWRAWEELDRGDVTVEDGLAQVVMGLENSLQYLHKIILEHPPTAKRQPGTS